MSAACRTSSRPRTSRSRRTPILPGKGRRHWPGLPHGQPACSRSCGRPRTRA
jgi:hypothetical protein